jgi:putative FmdB family regulatory protein
MPTYEYRCKACGEHVEVVQSFKDDPLTVCPACEGPLRKVFGNIGIAFKGSGFYKTDSRTAAKAGSHASSDGAASSSGSDSSSSSSDSGKSSSSDSGKSSSDGAKSSSDSGKSSPDSGKSSSGSGKAAAAS